MPLFLAWTIIIIVAFILLIFLRKFIKRLIFILVLLGIAFFIYRFFSPLGAEKVGYYIKTFPQQIASYFGGEIRLPFEEFQRSLSVVQVSTGDLAPDASATSVGEDPSSQEGNSFVSQLLDQMQAILQSSSSSVDNQPLETFQPSPSLPSDSENTEQLPASLPPVRPDEERIQPDEERIEDTVPSSTKPAQQSVNGLTDQEIREAEAIFGMLLGK